MKFKRRTLYCFLWMVIFLLPISCGDDDGGGGKEDATFDDAMVADAESGDANIMDGGFQDAEALDGSEPDGSTFICDPPAEEGSLFELEAEFKYDDGLVSMCKYRGDVILIVNVAANCGYTSQFGELAQLQTDYGDQGLQVLGFYSNQFMNQAGTPEEQESTEESYGVNFPVSTIINVNPPDEHPIFTWLKAQPEGDGDISWNFEKFLISREGVFLGRWSTQTEPDSTSITSAIEAAL